VTPVSSMKMTTALATIKLALHALKPPQNLVAL
jgi:hypothetical protein